jgi:hypothetical protein
MASAPDITLNEFPELYHNLGRQHLVPLWENRLTAHAT